MSKLTPFSLIWPCLWSEDEGKYSWQQNKEAALLLMTLSLVFFSLFFFFSIMGPGRHYISP